MADVNHTHELDYTAHVEPGESCTIGELLSAYLDGELRDGELDLVVEHLADCLECIAEFHDLKEARAAVRMMPMLQVPDSVMPAAHYGPELSAFLDGELTALGGDHGVLDHFLQLAQVAGPAVLEEALDRFGGDALQGLPDAPGVSLHEVLGEDRDIVPSLGEAGKREDVAREEYAQLRMELRR